MQLLNSNIPQSAQITKYSNKKAQDLLNLVLFMFVAFSYYKDGGQGWIRTTEVGDDRFTVKNKIKNHRFYLRFSAL